MVYIENAASIEHEGLTWIGEWRHYPPYIGQDGKVAPNCYLVVYQAMNGHLIHAAEVMGASRREIMDATMLLAKKRVEEVRNQLFPVGDETVESVLDTILDKVRDGDWMGQITHNQEFTTYELAALLNVSERKAMDLANSLQEDQKITLLAGGVIIPVAKEES